MDELLKRRVDRALAGLSDEQVFRVIDYAEFLQSKYGTRSTTPSPLERLADGVEDTLRVSRVPFSAIRGTRDVLDTADRVVRGITGAGQTVVDGIREQLREPPHGPERDKAGPHSGPKKTEPNDADQEDAG